MVLLEIVQDGDNPYSSYSNIEVMAMLQSGVLPNQPSTCPTPLYNVMCQCWRLEPNSRPTFDDLVLSCNDDNFADDCILHRSNSMLARRADSHASDNWLQNIVQVNTPTYIGTSAPQEIITPDAQTFRTVGGSDDRGSDDRGGGGDAAD